MGMEKGAADLQQAGSSSDHQNELPRDPVIPLLDKNPREIKTHVHTQTCT